MPQTNQVIQMRYRRRLKQKHNLLRNFGLASSAFISLAFVCLVFLLGMFYASLTSDLPSVLTLPMLLDPPDGVLLQPTRIYDRTGEHILSVLENTFVEQRQYLELPTIFGGVSTSTDQANTIPTYVILTTLATREPDFWNSKGYVWSGLLSNQHPTIAQQLVSDLLLWQEPPGLRRAIRERMLAAQITHTFGRPKILTWYLNYTKYGDLIYGVEAASRAYFGKPAAQLTLFESAILAAVAQSPSINPFTTPNLARQRGKELLSKLATSGLISPQEFNEANLTDQRFLAPPQSTPGAAQTFANLVLQELSQKYNRERIERGGFRIISTLDYDLQIQTNCAIIFQIKRMIAGSTEQLEVGDQQCLSARLLPALRESPIHSSVSIQTQALIQNPSNGQLLALATIESPNNLATTTQDSYYTMGNPSAPHPAGTILTPFIYLTGFTRGYSPATLMWDIPSANETIDRSKINAYHGPVRARIALVNDYLIPSSQILENVGFENVLKISSQLGLQIQEKKGSKDQSLNFSISELLNGLEVNLIELTQAYAVLSNGGILAGRSNANDEILGASPSIAPITVLLMEDYSGKVWEGDPALTGAYERVSKTVITPQLAYLVTNSLSDESARWPSLGHPNALEIGRPAGVKIGETLAGKDIWTIGYTPQLVVSVWMGSQGEDIPKNLLKEGITGIWHSVIQYASQNLPVEGWLQPPGIVQMEVCDPSGLLPDKDCPSTVSEIFLEGSQPTQTDTLYERLQINRETGRLATLFTPPEFIESRIYMMLPPQAVAWAKIADIPTPPDSYDVIQFSSSPSSSQARIDQPGMLAYIHGKVDITGTAAGPGFSSYRLRIGKGLYPIDWLQIGDESAQPVNDNTLGVWDTSNLNGLYTIQLMAIYQDQSIKTSVVQVTIDNINPKIEQIYPGDQQTLSIPQNGFLTIQPEVSDDLGIERVEIYLDSVLVSSLRQTPYVFPWQAQPGKHSLRVKAYDLAGNIAQADSNFILLPYQ